MVDNPWDFKVSWCMKQVKIAYKDTHPDSKSVPIQRMFPDITQYSSVDCIFEFLLAIFSAMLVVPVIMALISKAKHVRKANGSPKKNLLFWIYSLMTVLDIGISLQYLIYWPNADAMLYMSMFSDYLVALLINLILLYLMKKANNMLNEEEEDSVPVKAATVITGCTMVGMSILCLYGVINSYNLKEYLYSSKEVMKE